MTWGGRRAALGAALLWAGCGLEAWIDLPDGGGAIAADDFGTGCAGGIDGAVGQSDLGPSVTPVPLQLTGCSVSTARRYGLASSVDPFAMASQGSFPLTVQMNQPCKGTMFAGTAAAYEGVMECSLTGGVLSALAEQPTWAVDILEESTLPNRVNGSTVVQTQGALFLSLDNQPYHFVADDGAAPMAVTRRTNAQWTLSSADLGASRIRFQFRYVCVVDAKQGPSPSIRPTWTIRSMIARAVR